MELTNVVIQQDLPVLQLHGMSGYTCVVKLWGTKCVWIPIDGVDFFLLKMKTKKRKKMKMSMTMKGEILWMREAKRRERRKRNESE